MKNWLNLGKSKDCSNNNLQVSDNNNNLIQLSENMLADARAEITQKNTISIPIAQLASLGTGVASLVPAFRNVTQTMTFDTTGLYRVANAGVGDVLKIAKDGTNWGALKTANGASKMAKFQQVGSLSATSVTTLPIDPATIMIAVALASIEKRLDDISEMQKQILSFLETEKESEIEADVETLMKTLSNYKFNWDNTQFVTSNHKLILDIQRTAKKHMISYHKKINEMLNSNQFIVLQSAVHSTLDDLIKKFKYYRLSLYAFSMSSLVEILLSGNFKEDYITNVKNELEENSTLYWELYTQCSKFLKNMSSASFESNFLKNIGGAGKAVGQFLGNIPFVKDTSVDKFFQDSGSQIEGTAIDMENDTIKSFSTMNSPNTDVFIEKMRELIQIYNHTEEIYFDKEKIYLISN